MLKLLKVFCITILSFLFFFIVSYSLVYITQFYFNDEFIPEVDISKELNIIQKEKFWIISNLNMLNMKEKLSENDKLSSIVNINTLSELESIENNLLKEKKTFDNNIISIKKNTPLLEKIVFILFVSFILLWILLTILKRRYIFTSIWVLYLFFTLFVVLKEISFDYWIHSYLYSSKLNEELRWVNIYKNSPQYQNTQNKIFNHNLLKYQLKNINEIWKNKSYKDIIQEICDNEKLDKDDNLTWELLLKSCNKSHQNFKNSFWKIIHNNEEDWSVVYQIKFI
mgnify:FL=1